MGLVPLAVSNTPRDPRVTSCPPPIIFGKKPAAGGTGDQWLGSFDHGVEVASHGCLSQAPRPKSVRCLNWGRVATLW